MVELNLEETNVVSEVNQFNRTKEGHDSGRTE